MPALRVKSTVERLDKASSYASSKVRIMIASNAAASDSLQNRRRNQRYRDGPREDTPEDEKLKDATTLYVGNLSFYTTEEQIHELFSKCGEIKRLVMGLDRFNKTPCGFCFVEYYSHQDALDCMKYIGGTKLDERIIRTDLDEGFAEGRQYGYVVIFISGAWADMMQARKVGWPGARRVPRGVRPGPWWIRPRFAAGGLCRRVRLNRELRFRYTGHYRAGHTLPPRKPRLWRIEVTQRRMASWRGVDIPVEGRTAFGIRTKAYFAFEGFIMDIAWYKSW